MKTFILIAILGLINASCSQQGSYQQWKSNNSADSVGEKGKRDSSEKTEETLTPSNPDTTITCADLESELKKSMPGLEGVRGNSQLTLDSVSGLPSIATHICLIEGAIPSNQPTDSKLKTKIDIRDKDKNFPAGSELEIIGGVVTPENTQAKAHVVVVSWIEQEIVNNPPPVIPEDPPAELPPLEEPIQENPVSENPLPEETPQEIDCEWTNTGMVDSCQLTYTTCTKTGPSSPVIEKTHVIEKQYFRYESNKCSGFKTKYTWVPISVTTKGENPSCESDRGKNHHETARNVGEKTGGEGCI